jgi:hypothetical protein
MRDEMTVEQQRVAGKIAGTRAGGAFATFFL